MNNIKFVFISNYLNHHQIPFCNAMYELLGGSFSFIQTERMEQERIAMGWQEKGEYPYQRFFYEEPENCRELIENCAVALFGGTDEESYIQSRLEKKQPVIRYSERLYKTGQWKAVSPRGLRKKYYDHTRYRKQPVYLLCSGAYVPSDFHIVRAYPGKMLKWGYFPEAKVYDVDKLMAAKGWSRSAMTELNLPSMEGATSRETDCPSYLLWAARMIDWKHPELPVKTAKYLKEKGCAFHLDMVGGGELEPEVRRLIAEYDVEDVVTLKGYCTPEEVRSLMERADIYLATSDRREGWGAVINEAMNSGCAVVADHMMGAVPYLIDHEENGMVYEDGREEMLFRMTERLARDRAFCRQLGKNAYRTISEEWNSENAAKRLSAFCVAQGFLAREDVDRSCLDTVQELFVTEQTAPRMETVPCKEQNTFPPVGPCSLAPVISERKMFRLLTKK